MKIIAFVFIFFPLLSFSQTWSLEQCLDSALHNNITLKKGVLTQQIGSVTLKNSKQNLLPSVNANAVHGYNWGQTIDLFTNQFATNRVQYNNFFLSSSVVLFSGLQNYYTIRSAQFSNQQELLNQKIAERNLKIDISAAFLQVLLNESILEIAQNNLEKTENQRERISILKSQNQATQFEVSEIDAQLSLDNYQVIKTKNDVHYSKLVLKQLMNISETNRFDLDRNFDYLNGTKTNSAKDSLIPSLPDMALIELGVEKQLLLVKSTKGRYYPSLLLNGSLGSGYSGNNKILEQDGSFSPKPFSRQLNENFYQSVQLSLNIPVFNKNATRNQVKITEYQLESLYLDEQNQFNQLKQQLEKMSLEIINESEQYAALQKVNESTLLNFENFTIRYEAGDINYTQLVEMQNKRFDSESKLIQSEFQLKFKSMVLGYYFDN